MENLDAMTEPSEIIELGDALIETKGLSQGEPGDDQFTYNP